MSLSQNSKRVVFYGATGMLGRPVLKEMIQAGLPVTAFVRNPEKAKLPKGVEVVAGDLLDPSSVKSILREGDTVYLNLSVRPNQRQTEPLTEREGLQNLLSIGKEKKIGRVAYLSSLVRGYQGMHGFDWWVFQIKNEAVDRIEHSGIPYFVYNPSTFMENFNGSQRRGNTLAMAGVSKHPMWIVAGEDYGRQVVRSLSLPPSVSKSFSIQGPEGLRAHEAAERFIQNYPHSKLRISQAPLGLIKTLGMFSKSMNYLGHILEALNEYPEMFESRSTWDELGKPTVTVEAFARSSTTETSNG